MDLHGQIMNLRAGVPPVPDQDRLPGSAEVLWAQGYKCGHRDARHAAAELVAAASAAREEEVKRLREALNEIGEVIRWHRDDANTVAEWMRSVARAALEQQ